MWFDKREIFIPKAETITGIKYDLHQSPLSATKLETLLVCKRKFYYKYIKRLKEPQNILAESNAKIGLKLHKALERVFFKGMVLDDEKKVLERLRGELIQEHTKELEEFEQKSERTLAVLELLISYL